MLATTCATGLFDTIGFRFVLSAGVRRYPLLPLLAAHYSSEAVLKTIPAGLPLAEAVRVRMLKLGSGVPLGQSVATVLSRRLFLGTAQGAYLVAGTLIGFPALRALMSSWTHHQGFEWAFLALTLVITVGLGAMLLGAASGTLFQRLAAFIPHVRIKRIKSWLAARAESLQAADLHLRSLPSPRTLRFWKTGIWFFFAWCMEACETYLLLVVLGISSSLSDALALETLVSTLKLAAFFLPSGAVIQDTGYAGLLVAMGIAGNLEAAVPFVLLKRVRDLLFIVGGYLILAAHGIKPVRRLLRLESV